MKTEQKDKKKLGELLKDNLQKITLILVSIVYISQGLFSFVKRDTTILDILGNISLSLIVGTVISSSLSSMGLKDGRDSEIFKNSLKVYGETKTRATPNFDKLSAWCEYKNFQELELQKKDIIQSAGLNWKAYRYGYYEEHKEKLTESQILALERAKNASILKLAAEDLFSDLPKSKYGLKINRKGNKFGESEYDYKSRNLVNDIFIKLGISIVCGLYALVPIMTKENAKEIIAGIIWNTTQILLWIVLGTLKYANAKSFMENEYRQTHIIQKTEYLNEFIVTMQNNPKVIEEFDDELEINTYIEEFLLKKEEYRKSLLKPIEKEEKVVEEQIENEQETVLD